jgi:Bacterial aa3 type cytochrome c oxidase subunit IV
MADHGPVEYATARGNDLAQHQTTYAMFVQLAYVATLFLSCVLLALAIGGTTGHWPISFAILIFAAIIAVHGFATGARLPSALMVIISIVLLGLAAAS